MNSRRELAKVRRTFLGYEGHGILTCSLEYEGKSWAQNTSHYSFGKNAEHLGAFVAGLLRAHGVDRWESLVGRTVWVTHTQTTIDLVEPLEVEPGEPFDIKAWREALQHG